MDTRFTRRQLLKGLSASLFVPAMAISHTVQAGGHEESKPSGKAYDLIIKGGTVIDPDQHLEGIFDVAIQGGKIAKVDRDIPVSQASQIFKADHLIVCPGLIDLHAHMFPYVCPYGTEPDPSCLQRGTTTVVDAGSAGAFGLRAFRHFLDSSQTQTRVRSLLNISAMGNVSGPIPGMGELEELRFVDPKLAVRVINENKEFIVGLKVRCSEPISGPNDLEAVRRTRLAADEVHLPLMMHIGASYSPLPPLLAELKQGDVLTHPYHGRSHGVLNADGKILPEVIAARKRGVVFDVGHGGGNFSWTVAENCIKQDFAPDTISSDLGVLNLNGPVYDLATTLSKFLFLGLSLSDVVARATINASRVFDFGSSLGSLRPGADADVSVFELANGDFTLTDSEGKTRQGRQKLVPVVTLRGSKLFYPASSQPKLNGLIIRQAALAMARLALTQPATCHEISQKPGHNETHPRTHGRGLALEESCDRSRWQRFHKDALLRYLNEVPRPRDREIEFLRAADPYLKHPPGWSLQRNHL